jgi:endonuclease/exonuclease/phosphatase family metal-dependent hydrolase
VYFWNTFDQVLLRPELLDRFDIKLLVVPTTAGQTPLVTSDGRPNQDLASDHLPVVFELDL